MSGHLSSPCRDHRWGATGVELAGAIAELSRYTLARDFRIINPADTQIELVEAGPRLLSGFSEEMSDYAKARLERLGVHVRTGEAVEEVGPTSIRVAGTEVPVGLVIWAAGVMASPLARQLGDTDKAGRVTVDDGLRHRPCYLRWEISRKATCGASVAKSALDKDLKKVVRLETATYSQARSIAIPGLLVVFLLGIAALATLSVAEGPLTYLVIIAALIAAYMALNVGANDVANNMGPAVGSKALPMAGAIAIAAVCEAAGAILAGGDVVTTISADLLQPSEALRPVDFSLVMMAALLAGGIWIHLATVLGAPVSTTHSIVGGVIGAGVAAAGLSVVSWSVLGAIIASWIISPALGGMIASALLALIERTILSREDRVGAARAWVPVLVALMSGIFAMYLIMKGLRRLWQPDMPLVLLIGLVFFGIGWAAAKPWVRRQSAGMEDRKKAIGGLFTLPLIFATALLSFAHGANDVANAVWPLAAIVAAAETGSAVGDQVVLPLWVLVIGAVGIALGLALFGPRLIRTVGEKITKMNEIRAYCVAISAAITVLVASGLGLPVSSTHIAVGAIFGVGFLREFTTNRGVPNPAVQPRTLFLKTSRLNSTPEEALKNYQKREKRRLVRRQHVFGIAVAWVVTVPAAALLSALLYLLMSSLTA